MTERYDAIVIGAGHNGLTCAGYLSRAGRRVLVLEANEQPGGCAATREFAPGYSVSSCAQWLNQLHPAVVKDLALEQHGLRWAARDLASVSLDADGNHLFRLGNALQGDGLSPAERDAYRAFHQKTARYVRVLARLFEARAPKLVESNFTDRLTLLKLGLGMKMLGRDDMGDLLRIVLTNMYDLMQEHFENPLLQAQLSLDSVQGAWMGPRTPGTVFGYLYRRLGEHFGHSGQSLVEGGMGALGQAMAASVGAAGVEIRCAAPVTRIDITADGVRGVTTTAGEQFNAPVVVSNADPVSTYACLVGYHNMETDQVRRVEQLRCRSGTAKLHLALDGLPQFTGLDEEGAGQRLLLAPDMDYIERAFNALKYKECPQQPVLDISIPSVHDRSLAPAGGHVLSALVQFAPHTPEGGWETQRAPFVECILACLEVYAPDIREQVVAAELLTPADLERDYGMTGGHWHHGELSLDQIAMMRPFPGATQYATAFDGLYLCGAGSHPGGGLMGLAGKHAAREVIRRGTG